MKSVYVNDLRPNQDASGAFLVQSKDIRQKKSGEPYLSLSLSDKTGEIDAKMWDNVREVMDTFDRDDFVSAKGRVQLYQNKPQFTIHKLRRLDEAEVDFADFFPASARDPEEMFISKPCSTLCWKTRRLPAAFGAPQRRNPCITPGLGA